MNLKNIPLALVDGPDLIYGYTPAGAPVEVLYERGMPVFVCDGDVVNLLQGAWPAPGHYRTSCIHGLVQMGAVPVGPLTVDLGRYDPVSMADRLLEASRRLHGGASERYAGDFAKVIAALRTASDQSDILTATAMAAAMEAQTAALVAAVGRVREEVAALRREYSASVRSASA